MKRRLLIDADILLYRATAATEAAHEVDEDIWMISGNLGAAKAAFQDALKSITDALGSTEILLAISDTKNFRKSVYEPYKGNRKAMRKPVCYQPLKAWATDVYETGIIEGLEADDVLGLWATKPRDHDFEDIVVSDDKDLLTVPCTLWRQGELKAVSEDDADRQHLIQALTGDSTDGYPGCPGIGPVRAEKILGAFPAWDSVRQAYIGAGLTEDDALVQARLARILRWTDFDHDKGEPILWTPYKETAA